MIRILFTFLFFFLCLNLKAQDYSQISIAQYIATNNKKYDDPNLEVIHLTNQSYYLSLRCSAFSGWMSNKASKGNTEGEKILHQVHLTRSTEFMIISTLFYQWLNKTDSNISAKRVTDSVVKIINNYSADSKIIFAATGSYLKGYISEDMNACNGYYENREKMINFLDGLNSLDNKK